MRSDWDSSAAAALPSSTRDAHLLLVAFSFKLLVKSTLLYALPERIICLLQPSSVSFSTFLLHNCCQRNPLEAFVYNIYKHHLWFGRLMFVYDIFMKGDGIQKR
jgi:hypothetical protein